ncbi:unnamed protein product [Cuscuta epithymum]|uniref:DUF4408 domain-containing protein n=1 Tax=Cuscuta epithymum TaxID=186058 RepID=A0AAV0C5I5_9ASTE|nr:unnamed protein product [Cuscuta epithymum]
MFAETVSVMVPSSILAAMNSWLTPTVFFVILNVVIATIALTSSIANQTSQTHPQTTPKLSKSPSVLQRLRSINLPTFRSQEPVPKSNPDSDIPSILDSALNPHLLDFHMHHDYYQVSQETQSTHYIFRQDYLQENETQIAPRQENVEQNLTDDEKTGEIRAHFDFQVAREDEDKPDELYGNYGESTDRQMSKSESDSKPSAVEIPDRAPVKMTKSPSMKESYKSFEEEEQEETEARRPATTREKLTTVGDEEVDAKADDFINKFRQQLELQRMDSILRYKGTIRRGTEI